MKYMYLKYIFSINYLNSPKKEILKSKMQVMHNHPYNRQVYIVVLIIHYKPLFPVCYPCFRGYSTACSWRHYFGTSPQHHFDPPLSLYN